MNRKGQSLMEVLLAVAVGTVLIVGAIAIIAPLLRGGAQAAQNQIGAALARQLLDNVRTWSQGDWRNLYNLAKGSANTYFLVTASSSQIAVTGTEAVAGDNVTGDLFGYWKFDEGAGGSAYDFAGNNYTGTLTSSPAWQASSTCKVGGCLSYNTGGVYVDAGTGPDLGTSPFTITMWVKIPASNTDYTMFLQKGGVSCGCAPGYAMFAPNWGGSTTTLYFGIYGDIAPRAVSATNITNLRDGQWHFAVLRRRTDMALEGYWDMNLFQTETQNGGNVNAAASSLLIGEQFGSGLLYQDDVRIYTRALSADELKSIYNASVFYRSFYVENVSRTLSQNSSQADPIVSSGGTNDRSTQKVTVLYRLPSTINVARSIATYVARLQNFITRQTDWSGGSGQAGPVTSTNSSFASSSNIDVTTTTGSFRINGL